MIHTLIFAATLAALAGLLAAAFAPAEYAALRGWWSARRVAARAWRDGTELVAGLAAITAELPVVELPPWRTAPDRPDGWVCPWCERTRCRPGREGQDCQQAPMAERPAYWRRIPAGRHTTALAAARWLAGDWWDADLPIRLRRELGRLAGAGTIPAGVS